MKKILRTLSNILLGSPVVFEDFHSVNWLDNYTLEK